MASIYANLLEQKKVFTGEKGSTPRGFAGYTNMATVTSCENTQWQIWSPVTILIPRNSQYHTTYAFYTVTHINTIILWLWLRLWLWLSSLSLIRGSFYDHFPGNSKTSNFILILKKCRPLQSSGSTWRPFFFKWLSLKILRYHCGQTSHNEWYYLVCLCSPRQTNIVNVFL